MSPTSASPHAGLGRFSETMSTPVFDVVVRPAVGPAVAKEAQYLQQPSVEVAGLTTPARMTLAYWNLSRLPDVRLDCVWAPGGARWSTNGTAAVSDPVPFAGKYRQVPPSPFSCPAEGCPDRTPPPP